MIAPVVSMIAAVHVEQVPIPDVTLDSKLHCTAAAPNSDVEATRSACLDALIPRTARFSIETPGAFFVGYAVGKNSQAVYGPAVGIMGAIGVPLVRPSLEWRRPQTGPDYFRLPQGLSFTMDFVFSFGVNLGAFIFPNAPMSPSGQTQAGLNLGGYAALQLGAASFAEGSTTPRRFAISLGVLAGYINTDATGSAFVIGFQPALVVNFN